MCKAQGSSPSTIKSGGQVGEVMNGVFHGAASMRSSMLGWDFVVMQLLGMGKVTHYSGVGGVWSWLFTSMKPAPTATTSVARSVLRVHDDSPLSRSKPVRGSHP